MSGKSNNEIILVLQYYDYDVEKAIQAYVEGRRHAGIFTHDVIDLLAIGSAIEANLVVPIHELESIFQKEKGQLDQTPGSDFFNPLYTDIFFHCYNILDKSVVFLGVSGVFFGFYSFFDGKSLANIVDPDQTPHYGI